MLEDIFSFIALYRKELLNMANERLASLRLCIFFNFKL